jgi:two-component system, cell cycle sensor histidine kinase and response regulator CckA
LEAVGQLAGGIAHDFNNLLTAIICYAELITRHSKPTDVIHEEAEQIVQAGEQAVSLTRQLLAFSRKQILQRVLDRKPLVLNIEKLLQRVIGAHIELRVEAMAREARVLADQSQIEQVLLNLGVNARDAIGVKKGHTQR